MELTPNCHGTEDNETRHARAAPGGVGRKFYADGRVRYFPGNTVICHLDASTPIFAALEHIQAELGRGLLAPVLSFLPPASFHMTVFGGAVLAGSDSGAGEPPHIDPAVLDEIHERMRKKLIGVEAPARFRMRIGGLGFRNGGVLACHFEPWDRDEERQLRGLRDLLSGRFELLEPDHDTYEFHVSLAYLLRPLSEAELLEYRRVRPALLRYVTARIRDFTLGPAEFCSFQNMHHFKPLLRFE